MPPETGLRKGKNSTTFFSMTDFLATLLGEKLKKTRSLSDAMAWYESFDLEFKKQILDWIRIDQLREKGVDEDGDVIGYYSLYTEILSGGRKKFGDHYTLEDTGAFYRSMFITVFRDSIVIDADPIKGQDNLFFKYGEGIIGLTEENMGLLQQEIKKKYIEKARSILEID